MQLPSPARPSRLMPLLLAGFVALVGLVNIVSALVGIEPGRLDLLLEAIPLEVSHTGRTLAVLSGLLLMLLSRSLLRRKRRAWVAATLLLSGSVLLHLLKGLDFEEAGLSLLVLLTLLASRRSFSVRSDRAAAWSILPLALAGLLAALLYGLLGFALLRHHFTPDFSFSRALSSSLLLLSQSGPPPLQPLPGHRDALWFSDSMAAASIFGVLYFAGLLVRPVSIRLLHRQGGRDEALAILQSFPGRALAYYTLLPGLAYVFGPGRRSYLALRVVDGWALVLGDPLGDPEEIPALLTQFAALCRDNDWKAVWYQTGPRWLAELRRDGAVVLPLGEEALVELDGFELSGKAMQSLRTARSRMQREGFSIGRASLDADGRREELRAVSQQWLAQRRGRELGFSLGTFELFTRFASEQECILLTDNEGRARAFVTFTPRFAARQDTARSAAAGGWCLDLMRAAPGLPPGAMEALLCEALLQFKAEGIREVSLALSPLSREDGAEDPLLSEYPEYLERGRELVLEHLTRLYNFEGLHRFKQKFQPRWEPRYLVCPGLLSLPQVLLALTRAHRQAD